MAESAFAKLAMAESEAEAIKQAGLESQRQAVLKAHEDAEAIVANARENATKALESLEAKLKKRDAEAQDNIGREVNIKCSYVRTKAEERRKTALDYIFKGVTNSGN